MVDGVEIHRVWTSWFGRGNLVGRAFDYATFYLSAAWRLWHLARRGDIVVAKTDPPMLSVLIGPVARQREARCVNWLQDIFPEVAEALGTGGTWVQPLLRRLRWLRNRSLRAADINVVLGERMAERLIRLGIATASIRIIPNWADGALLQPIAPADNPLRAQWGLGNAFVVSYSGNLGRAHEIDTLLGAMAAMQSGKDPAVTSPIAWLFVGGGALYGRLQRETASRGIAGVTFQPYQPRATLAQSLSAADVHIVSLQPALEGLIVPSKIYGIMAVGRPTIFIGDTDGEVARMLERYTCGRVVAQGDSAGLARALMELAGDPDGTARMGARARQALLMDYDKPLAVDSWADVLRDLDHDERQAVG